MSLSKDNKLRLIVAICALAVFVVTGFINPVAATTLSFPLILAVMVAPYLFSAFQNGGLAMLTFVTPIILVGVVYSFVNPWISLTAIALGFGILPFVSKQTLQPNQLAKPKPQAKDPNRPRTNTQRRRDAKLLKK